jgi:hypothetical protein
MLYLRYYLSILNSNRNAKYHSLVSCPHHSYTFIQQQTNLVICSFIVSVVDVRRALSEINNVMNTTPTPFYYLCSWLHRTVRIVAGQ